MTIGPDLRVSGRSVDPILQLLVGPVQVIVDDGLVMDTGSLGVLKLQLSLRQTFLYDQSVHNDPEVRESSKE